MTNRSGFTMWVFHCACLIYLGAAGEAAAAAASPKLIACLNACEQVQTACLQPPLQIPREQRTIKELNVMRACNVTDVKCDRRCRK
jgi:hypothetical protein